MFALHTFKHTEQHRDQVLLKVQQLLQEVHLGGVLGQFFLHVSKEEQEASNGVPESLRKKVTSSTE